MKLYAIFDYELEMISMFNATSAIFFALTTFFLGLLGSAVWDVMPLIGNDKGWWSALSEGQRMYIFQMSVMSVFCFILSASTWWKKKSRLDFIKSQAKEVARPKVH